MKPRIRKNRGMGPSNCWLCLTRNIRGDSWYKGGVGLSPAEAYADWARQNNVNQDA